METIQHPTKTKATKEHVCDFCSQKIWKTLSKQIKDEDKKLFETEWNHFQIGEIDVDQFSFFFEQYINKNNKTK